MPDAGMGAPTHNGARAARGFAGSGAVAQLSAGPIGRYRGIVEALGPHLLVTFTDDVHVTYELDYTSEDHWTVFHGTYEILTPETLVIDVDHQWSGELIFSLSGDVLQLDDISGRRMVFNRSQSSAQ